MKELFYGDRLGQVTRLVDILTLAYSDMICQKLQRNGGYQWLEALHDIRQFNHLVGDMGNGIITLRYEGNHPTLTRLDLLNIREHFLIQEISFSFRAPSRATG